MIPILFAFFQSAAAAQPASTVQCQLHPKPAASRHWEGSCGQLFGQAPRITLDSAKSVTSGRWRSDAEPLQVWAGEMTDSGYPNAKIELEVYPHGQTVLRTAYGWFMVPHYHDDPASMTFAVDTLQEAPPSDLDREIAKRADAMLSSVALWNRADNRQCPASAATLSIYCAMERAAAEVTGATHHRRPAMQVVRRIVDERSAGRDYAHRLMDYNNDPKTTLADVHSLFAEALARMNAMPSLAKSAVATAAAPSAPKASPLDLKVIARAQQLLGSASSWNRKETQRCLVKAHTFGIFCALKQALEDVTGQFDEESIVLNDARTVVDFVAAKHYGARLVNYNNDPGTSFADIQAFFRILRNRAVKRLAT